MPEQNQTASDRDVLAAEAAECRALALFMLREIGITDEGHQTTTFLLGLLASRVVRYGHRMHND